MISRSSFRCWSGCLILASGLVSCDGGPDPGLVEKTALLEAELRSRDERIAALEDAAKEAAETPASSSAPSADVDAARSAYPGFVDGVRASLEEKLGVGKVGTSMSPVMTSPPILAQAVFRPAGRPEIVVPLSADASGQWQEPDLDAAIQKSKESPAAANRLPQQQSQPAPPRAPAEPSRTEPRDVMGASQTHRLEWGDAPKPAPQPAPPSGQSQVPAPAPAPQAPQVPPKPVPSDRDVIIKF